MKNEANGIILLSHSGGSAFIPTVLYECVIKKIFFHFYSLHLKAPGGQSPAQTHAAALLCAHANMHRHTYKKKNTPCETDFYVNRAQCIFPQKNIRSWGFIS